MNWSVLTKKQQVMVIGTVVAAVAQIVILIYFMGGQDSGDSSAKSSKLELAQLEEKLDQARLVLAKSAMIQTALDETVTKLDELSVHTPSSADRYAWAYEYVSLRAAKSGVELDSLEEIISKAGGEDVPPSAQAYEIRLSTQCGYNQLVEFLWQVENDNPLVRVKNVDITAAPESLDRHKIRVSLQWPAGLKVERESE
jgi:hypothetical protein